MGITDNISYIRDRIREAAEKSGRDPQDVTIIAVTKTVPVEKVLKAVQAGLLDVGENRVQEAQDKRSQLEALLPSSEPRPQWHLIGHLQRNKVKTAVRLFDLIHSVDSARLVREIAGRAQKEGRTSRILLEVNVSGESTKQGCRPSEVEVLVQEISNHPQLSLQGLMTLAPFSEDPETSRPVFRQLKKIYNRIADSKFSNVQMRVLSMGMSQDYQVAVEEGANMVRIGRAIFGGRHVR